MNLLHLEMNMHLNVHQTKFPTHPGLNTAALNAFGNVGPNAAAAAAVSGSLSSAMEAAISGGPLSAAPGSGTASTPASLNNGYASKDALKL